MGLSEDIYSRLSTDTDLTALVPANRIYPDEGEEGAALPIIVYGQTQAQPADGLGAATTITRFEYTVETWALRATEANQIADLVRARLNRWTGGNVHQCRWLNQTNDVDENGWHRALSFAVWYRE